VARLKNSLRVIFSLLFDFLMIEFKFQVILHARNKYTKLLIPINQVMYFESFLHGKINFALRYYFLAQVHSSSPILNLET